MPRDYSDLEVYHGDAASAPVVVQEEKIAYLTLHGASPSYSETKLDRPAAPVNPRRKCCGVVLTRTKIALLVIGLLLIIGGIAGGVAGGLLSRNHSSSPPASPSQPATTEASSAPHSDVESSTKTTQESVTITTSTEIGPTQTLYRDCPSSNNTVYNAIGSAAYQFRKICGASYKQPRANVVNQAAASLNDCIDLCIAFNINNKTEIASGRSSPCNSVCWRNNVRDPDWPGQCFGSTTINSTAGFQYNDEDVCDSGAWINQSF